MKTNLLDLYEQASDWTLGKVQGAATKLDDATPCDEWDVRHLMSHMLETQKYFVSAARGAKASPPSGDPPDLLSKDPVADFKLAQAEHAQHVRPARRHRQDRAVARDRVRRSAVARVGLGEGDAPGHDDAEGPSRGGLRDDPRTLHRRAAQGRLQARGASERRRVGTGQAARVRGPRSSGGLAGQVVPTNPV